MNENIKVIKDLLPKDFCRAFHNFFMEPVFPWYFNPKTSYVEDDKAYLVNHDSIFQFTHNVYHYDKGASDFFHMHFPQFFKILGEKCNEVPDNILRVKANLVPKQIATKEQIEQQIHNDWPDDQGVTAIYYVNETDGDTVLLNDDKSEMFRYTPVPNSLLIFPSNIKHYGEPPRKHQRRIVINIVTHK